MIETRTGVKIEFTRLDEWAIQITVSIPHIKGDKVVASPVTTINKLREELTVLEQTEPPDDV